MGSPRALRAVPPRRTRVNVLGVGIDAVNMSDALGILGSAIWSGTRGWICATGVHGVMESQHDQSLKRIINHSLLTLPDGRPMMWLGRLGGQKRMTQVTGPDFMLSVCRRSLRTGYTHFLYGGKPGVADQLKNSLEQRFHGLQIVGTYTPPFGPLSLNEQQSLRGLVSRLRPDIFWIGISTPKQERFMAEYLHLLETTVMVGVGAAFDLHTGNLQDAPRWIKAAGMQWLHRLLQDPRRLWKRYLFNNTCFLAKIALQWFRLKTYELV
jgi:N-acetylglucosaminyldiphosphoundecaprenol N-acetyl-beta-D-mannosaminyltransferase